MYKTSGFLAFILHRITGLGLVLYLFIHIFVMNSVNLGYKDFNNVMKFLQNPIFKFLEALLLAGIIFHALNGLRIIFVDLGFGVKHQKSLFFGLTILGIIIFIIGAYPLIF
jgi:succinate dehydrogenase / fumarate reductase cytochrome b subunit